VISYLYLITLLLQWHAVVCIEVMRTT
jgi:hypothetical protein